MGCPETFLLIGRLTVALRFSKGWVRTDANLGFRTPATCKHDWSKHGSSRIWLIQTWTIWILWYRVFWGYYARTMFTPTMFSRRWYYLDPCPWLNYDRLSNEDTRGKQTRVLRGFQHTNKPGPTYFEHVGQGLNPSMVCSPPPKRVSRQPALTQDGHRPGSRPEIRLSKYAPRSSVR